MQNINRMSLTVMSIMVVLSFTNFFGVKIAGAAVMIGVIFFFINKAYEKQPISDSGLDVKAIGTNLKSRSIWFWMALPIIMDAISISISKLFLPEYIDHVLARTEIFVSFDKVIILVFQLIILALGEEIAWRAFFQKQLNKVLPIVPTLLLSSLLFAFGHITEGNTFIVVYDIFFVFINSVLYGVIFYKTNNAWVSGISHFLANLFSVIILVFL
ncbi:CPBP family intramembrane glutamic endopeptidase [Bacillus tuaregi]|uniref:CPBP family intramembrane glutamic endopeptidase n=1 Tax=Bacillus tuaregi TaxID=1816695 RepID=UPI0008F8AA46|nr:type II CAAX endopeptidase family protein [Bacillus tuaregi]